MTLLLDLPRIMKELKLDVPVYRVKAHDDCVELHLYGGKVVTWRPKQNGDPLPVISEQQLLPLDLPQLGEEEHSPQPSPIEGEGVITVQTPLCRGEGNKKKRRVNK